MCRVQVLSRNFISFRNNYKYDEAAAILISIHKFEYRGILTYLLMVYFQWKSSICIELNISNRNTRISCAQTGYMKVVIPPDIMDLDDTADLLTTKENGDLRLRCRATGTPEPVVIWRREDGRNITLRNEHVVKRSTLLTSNLFK